MYNINGFSYFIGELDKITCDKIINLAENKWEKGIDIIMVGHYHQQKIITKNEK